MYLKQIPCIQHQYGRSLLYVHIGSGGLFSSSEGPTAQEEVHLLSPVQNSRLQDPQIHLLNVLYFIFTEAFPYVWGLPGPP